MPSTATLQPQQLKKKASFRDRLRAWQKPPPALEIAPAEPKARLVYEPKHAAADFSRLAISPRMSPPRQRLPRPMQTLAEDDTVPQRLLIKGDDDDAPFDEPRRGSRASSGVKRHSYTLAEEGPSQATQAAAGSTSRPTAWTTPGVGTQLSGAARKAEAAAAAVAEGNESEEAGASAPQPPPSDYELFIARAEAEERERRDLLLLRSMSLRSTAASSAAGRVKPDPHRQFASAAAAGRGRSSAEMSDNTSRQARRNSARLYAPGESGEQQQQQREEREQAGRRTHARRSSWAAPSYTTGGGSGSERVPERSKSSRQGPTSSRGQTRAQPTQQPTHRSHRPPEAAAGQAMAHGSEDKPSLPPPPPPPRTLRRQASLSQRIAEYIRPSKAAVRPVETLVE